MSSLLHPHPSVKGFLYPLKAIESSRHGKMKMNKFLIEHLGIQYKTVDLKMIFLTLPIGHGVDFWNIKC